MSQRVADELENRRGLTLGLTLAEVLLLLLFLLLLALSWRVDSLQREYHMALDDLAHVQRINADLSSTLRGLEATSSDRARLEAVNAAIAAAVKINPNDPAEVLTRAVDVLKRLGSDVQPSQIKTLSEMLNAEEKLKALDKAISGATRVNPNDPAEVLTRAVEVLTKLGIDATPDEIVPIQEMVSLNRELDQVTSERNNLMHTGNGLTYPSCWRTPEGRTEYIFDITIRDSGMVVRDATPSRAHDPAMQLVSGLARNELVNEAIFRRGTISISNYSKGQNCRFYSIIRDETGPTSKARYKQLRGVVEGNFYISLRSGGRQEMPMGAPSPALGWPMQSLRYPGLGR
jgi:hypothetical protein